LNVKTIELELPEAMARQVEELVRSGLYVNSAEAVRHALKEFLQQHLAVLAERQQLADVAWAVRDLPEL
jgi:Arc/MetJ-type ribon-helix-helix transcriptional regulator